MARSFRLLRPGYGHRLCGLRRKKRRSGRSSTAFSAAALCDRHFSDAAKMLFANMSAAALSFKNGGFRVLNDPWAWARGAAREMSGAGAQAKA
ncbi:hypothetical protein [uncultured Ottowia sp.]|uniref:hypothetical protein n=1 Tax=uncultured Ottowia sp. TaxID=543067 RepID=UPI00259756D5|nr:hypothetical protein [uncultured Ottowia sp.]